MNWVISPIVSKAGSSNRRRRGNDNEGHFAINMVDECIKKGDCMIPGIMDVRPFRDKPQYSEFIQTIPQPLDGNSLASSHYCSVNRFTWLKSK
jgi:hypothetical protein